MDFSTIQVSWRDSRGAIVLNRPHQLNPLGPTMPSEMVDAARFFDSRPEIKVVVVSGQGRAFSAGADLAVFPVPTARLHRPARSGRRRTRGAAWPTPSRPCAL